MCAVIHLIDYSIILPLWRSKKIDLIPFLVTFVACLLWGLEWGILLGIVVNLSMLLFSIATPSVKVALIPPGVSYSVLRKPILNTCSNFLSCISHRRSLK